MNSEIIISIFLNIFLAILFILTFWAGITNLYNIFLSFFGWGKTKRDYKLISPETSFLILIAAHNEEDVIEDTLINLEKIDYDKNLYDIVVVSDNSTDNTTQICRDRGYRVVDTIQKEFPREGVGKPGGLQYALREIGFENVKNNYDLLMVLDADNYVDSNILTEINSQYQHHNHPTCIQTYLDSKNHGSVLSVGYNCAYFYSNRFFQLSKYRLGLPNSIGGTGFFVKTDFLIDSGGFNYSSLTEDLEMEIEIVEQHGKVLWNHFVRIYDEKPDDLKVSIKQRIRWAQGHWYVAFTNFFTLIKLFFKERKWKYIDQLIYLFGMTKSIQLLLIFISFILVLLVSIITQNGVVLDNITMNISNYLTNNIVLVVISNVYAYFMLVPYALHMDAKVDIPLYKAILGLLYMGWTYIYCQIIGLFKCRNQKVWVKTPHKYTTESNKISVGESN